ncbi:MAG: hypothetical protein OXN83_02760, partial [Oligoflexia bacterium]|nr:hypothetical protein [Oligoflexia bacterium]
MLSFNKLLLFSVFVLFVSCGPKNSRKVEERKRNSVVSNLVLFEVFSRTVDEYKEVIRLLKEEKDTYSEMVHLSYKANKIYNEIVERQKISVEAIDSLKAQVRDLNDLILSLDVSVSEEVFDRLNAIQSDLEVMEDFLTSDFTQSEEAQQFQKEAVEEPMTETAPEGEAVE